MATTAPASSPPSAAPGTGQDTALALHGRGRPRATFQALLAAERDTPQEVRFRPWAQQLTTDLLTRGHNLPGVREFANRVGVA
ncbi:hypothetical protein Van01_37910 [Micromonospora andamanensis]|uniref:Uncharacterized protein n=1 Tax=Micromonospora andamanensis TaxID=1287068 RepID=A0ABQ4HY47_9ACTN|nr:hypothetical protein Van01_37910 [Micromonospora andamanensis]